MIIRYYCNRSVVFKKTPTVPLLCIIIPFVILDLCRLSLKQRHQKQEIITNRNNSDNYSWFYLYVRNENPTYWNGINVTQTLLKCPVHPPSPHFLLNNQGRLHALCFSTPFCRDFLFNKFLLHKKSFFWKVKCIQSWSLFVWNLKLEPFSEHFHANRVLVFILSVMRVSHYYQWSNTRWSTFVTLTCLTHWVKSKRTQWFCYLLMYM